MARTRQAGRVQGGAGRGSAAGHRSVREANRRHPLRVGTIAPACLVAAPAAPPFTPNAQAAAAGVWNHDPLSPIGPAHWADIGFPVCGSGSRQSPIDIRTATVGVRGRPR